jgi:preprotein translocase subunit SecE
MENVEQPKRVVGVFYVASAIIIGVFLSKLLASIFNAAGVNDFRLDFGFVQAGSLSGLIGYGVAVVAAVIVWRMPRTQQVSLDVALELRRVTWPSWRETRAATVAVIVASFIAAVILGLFDFGWSHLADLIYGAGKSMPR